MARGIAVFALLLLVQAMGSMLAQTPFMAWWWNAVFLAGFLAVFALLFIRAMWGRETTPLAATAAVLVLLGYVTWPLAAPAPLPEGSGPPWLWAMINVGAALCAYAAGTRIAAAYTVVLGVVFALVRASGSGGGAGVGTALQDSLLATVMGLIIVLAIGILRQAADRSDAAAEEAIREYRQAAQVSALRSERARFDALLHDSVMTVLLGASGLDHPGSRSTNAALARSAIQRLEASGREAPESRAVAPAELEARIRFANDTGHGSMALVVEPASGDGTRDSRRGGPGPVRGLHRGRRKRQEALAGRHLPGIDHLPGAGRRAPCASWSPTTGRALTPRRSPPAGSGSRSRSSGAWTRWAGWPGSSRTAGRGTAVELLWPAGGKR